MKIPTDLPAKCPAFPKSRRKALNEAAIIPKIVGKAKIKPLALESSFGVMIGTSLLALVGSPNL